MAAPIGNKYYLLAVNPGRPRKLKSPTELWVKACEYFEWIDNNPIEKNDFKGKDNEEVTYKLAKPYTLHGLCLFLNIDPDTWNDYKKKRKEFSGVIRVCEQIIRTQKFEGAAAGIFQHNIIARDLGLVDKTDQTSKGKAIRPIIKFVNTKGNNNGDTGKTDK